ncbi:MAG: hypothetical protein AAF743_00780 [Planctomycetota bacterium]
MTLLSVAPLAPLLGIGTLIDAIGQLIVPAIIVLFIIIGNVANWLAKRNRQTQDPEEREAELRERRRRMEEALGLPQGSIRGSGEEEPLVERAVETSGPVIGGRVVTAEPPRPRTERRPEPRRPVEIRRPEVARPTPPPVPAQRPPSNRDKRPEPATTGEIGASEIGGDEISDAIGTGNRTDKKRRHPVAELLRRPETVKQVIAAKAVLDRPEW